LAAAPAKATIPAAIEPEDLHGPEWAEWCRLTPQERWRESQRLWQTFLALGGSLDPEPDSQSPFFDADAPGPLPPDGRPGMRIVRRSGVWPGRVAAWGRLRCGGGWRGVSRHEGRRATDPAGLAVTPPSYATDSPGHETGTPGHGAGPPGHGAGPTGQVTGPANQRTGPAGSTTGPEGE